MISAPARNRFLTGLTGFAANPARAVPFAVKGRRAMVLTAIFGVVILAEIAVTYIRNRII
jgi:hypothetical protein